MPSRSLAGIRFLIVEYEFFLADDLRQILTDQGAELVMLRSTLGGALRQIRDDGFDVALLDISLHGESVFEAADVLTRAGIPFGFAIGYDQKFLPPRFAHAPHWTKPYDIKSLVRGLQRLVGRSDG